MKVTVGLISVLFIAFSLLLLVEDCKGGKVKNGPGGGGGALANVGKVAKKGGLGKKAAAAAVVVGGGAAGYVAYKGIKKAVKHGRDDDSSEEYYGNGNYGNNGNYGRERQYYGSGTRMSGWNPNLFILAVIACLAGR